MFGALQDNDNLYATLRYLHRAGCRRRCGSGHPSACHGSHRATVFPAARLSHLAVVRSHRRKS
jgi:hypothetical protein